MSGRRCHCQCQRQEGIVLDQEQRRAVTSVPIRLPAEPDGRAREQPLQHVVPRVEGPGGRSREVVASSRSRQRQLSVAPVVSTRTRKILQVFLRRDVRSRSPASTCGSLSSTRQPWLDTPRLASLLPTGPRADDRGRLGDGHQLQAVGAGGGWLGVLKVRAEEAVVRGTASIGSATSGSEGSMTSVAERGVSGSTRDDVERWPSVERVPGPTASDRRLREYGPRRGTSMRPQPAGSGDVSEA